MPTCCIKNCASRTDRTSTRGLKFYRFPKETDIRQQWLDACQRNETNIKIDSAHICNLHFEADCFQMKWTKPRSNNVPAKQIQRLRKSSIPTKLLILQKKRKEIMSKDGTVEKGITNEKKKAKLPVKTGIPTYAELVQCIQEKQYMHQGQALEQDKDEYILPHDAEIKQQMVKTEISTQAKLAKCTEEEQCIEEEEQEMKKLMTIKVFLWKHYWIF